jgi:DNA-binding protein YbaB
MFFADRKLKHEMVQTIKMLNHQLDSSNKFIANLQEELSLERAKAVSRNEFIAVSINGELKDDRCEAEIARDEARNGI